MNVGSPLVEVCKIGRDFIQRRRLFQRRAEAPVMALDDVSFSIGPGECLALTGPNGAGKSTLLRILATIVMPSRGRATITGFDLEHQSGQVRGAIGYQGNSERSFFWPLTGMENLTFFGRLAGLTSSDALEASRYWLDAVGLASAENRRVSGYSSGMRQRLALARALIHRPSVLLLDEPTANLDSEYRDVAIQTIDELCNDGRSVIVATHDPGLVSATATTTLRLENGRIQQHDAVSSPVRYLVTFAPSSGEYPDYQSLEVHDLGDGHALSTVLSNAIADGRDIVAVERQAS